MTELEIILTCVVALSVLLNVAVFVYARSAISRLLYVSEELGDLKTMVDSFSEHVSGLYQLEMYYGDQTLQGLVDHAQSFNEQLETFEFIYTLTEAENTEEETGLIENQNETDNPQAEEN
jgi:argininosuccinate synthase